MANNRYDRSKPKYEWGDGWMRGKATEKQAQFIASLIDRIASKRQIQIQVIVPLNEMNKGTASGLIDYLKRIAYEQDDTRELLHSYGKTVAVQE